MKIKKIFLTVILLSMVFSLNAYAKKNKDKDKKNTEDNKPKITYRDKFLSKYQYDKGTDKLICVDYVADSNAILKMYERDNGIEGKWNLVFATDAFVGQRGVGKQREEDLKTPLGEFNITKAFGIKPNPMTSLRYIEVNENTYACDEDCEYYNQIIDTSKTEHKCYGERLIKGKPQYNYGLCFDYNKENIYPKGSAIFICVKGNKNYTSGSIAVDEESMIKLLQNATEKTKVCIYESNNTQGIENENKDENGENK